MTFLKKKFTDEAQNFKIEKKITMNCRGINKLPSAKTDIF